LPLSTLFPYTTLFRSRRGGPPFARGQAPAADGRSLSARHMGGVSQPAAVPARPHVGVAAGVALTVGGLVVRARVDDRDIADLARSEEHTSELQSLRHL